MKKILILLFCLAFLLKYSACSAKSSEEIYQDHITSLQNMTQQQLKEKFFFTEVVSNNIPNSIEFWTEAYCPFEKKYSYIIPYDFDLVSCEKGIDGSHGGCTTCAMSKIKLKLKPISTFYEAYDFPYKEGQMTSILKEFGITKAIKSFSQYYLYDFNNETSDKNTIGEISQIRKNYYIKLNGIKYGPYQQIVTFGSKEYPAFYYRFKNKYYANIAGNILGPYDSIIKVYRDQGGFLIFYRNNKEYFINLNNKIEKTLACNYINITYNKGNYVYDCLVQTENKNDYYSPMSHYYNIVKNHQLYYLGDAPDPNSTPDYIGRVLVRNDKFLVPFFTYQNWQQSLYYDGNIYGSYDLFKSDLISENNLVYFIYEKGGSTYLKIIQKLK